MSYSKISKRGKEILISWVIVAVVFFSIGMLVGFLCSKTDEPMTMVDVTIQPTNEATATPTVEPTAEPTPKFNYISIGEYRLTAYCSCEKCCGYWATVRPLDENGKPIVYTANKSIAKQGVTVAADTDILPFGTVLLIDGHEFVVQDRGGAIKENRIDIYFESHEEALRFGIQYKEIFVKEKNE